MDLHERPAGQNHQCVPTRRHGAIGQIVTHIRTEKTLSFLFEHATKVAGEVEQPACTSDLREVIRQQPGPGSGGVEAAMP